MSHLFYQGPFVPTMSSSRKKSTQDDSVVAPVAPAVSGIPVVAIGASSGGLKALEEFFRNVPPETGIAFVVAMHLSPEHESQLAHILQAFTTMPVMQVSSSVEIAPNQVYVIAPGQHLLLRGNKLDVAARSKGPALGVIDHLFQSLAEDRKENAVGIILSGSGADGTVGLRAIKEYGGLLLAQDPDDAEYASMPHSIIETGLVDFILPAAEMPQRLVALQNAAPRSPGNPAPKPDEEDHREALQSILSRLHARTGYDFSHYKRTAMMRHLGRRMLLHNDEDPAAYATRLQKDDDEVAALFRSMLVRVTRFFRDPKAYQALERQVISKLFKDIVEPENGQPAAVRVWVPGCATGEEVYSLAMLLAESRDQAGGNVPLQILASDIDDEALAVARVGEYPDAVVAGVSKPRLERFFERKDGAYQVRDEVRAQVVFATHDVTRDPPFARIDLLSCRNLLIYFDGRMQQHVLERCAYSLRAGGYLFLGSAESTGRASTLFTPISRKYGLFRRSDLERTSTSLDFFPIARTLSSAARRTGAPGVGARTPRRDRVELPDRPESVDVEPTNDALIQANQEMQSLNEELRSMMEELEVAKEEMQSLNEELTTLNQELQNKIEQHRSVNSDLHVLIESTHMATLFLDRQLNVVLFTPESTKLFSLLPVDIGRPLAHLSHRLRYTGVIQDAKQVLEHAVEVNREVQDEADRWYALRALPYPTADGPAEGVVLTFADITAQKQVEQVSEDRFSLAFHAGPMAASIVTQDDGRFLDVNHIFEEITGYSRDAVVGQPARSFGLVLATTLDSASTDGQRNSTPGVAETRLRSRSGAMHHLVVSTTAIEFEGRPCYLSFFYDVTERKRLEREILLVSDREQRRIGVDLHDGLGTHLTGVAMMARGLARNLRNNRTVRADEVDEIARLLSDGIEQARTLAQGLNPFLLEARGLSVALRELASNLEARTGIACTYDEEGSGPPLSSEQSMHLYRITQEALANATRHAKANQIRITLARMDHRYRLEVEDNGTGFDEGQADAARGKAPGMGLSIMRHRAEMIGAHLSVASSPGSGTTITCSV